MSNRWSTRILEHNFLAADVRRLILEKPEQAPNFCAGQYLQLIVDDQRFPFSIASAPHTDHLELHIKPTEGSADSLKVEQYLKGKPTSVDFTYPHGTCCVDSVPACPVILIGVLWWNLFRMNQWPLMMAFLLLCVRAAGLSLQLSVAPSLPRLVFKIGWDLLFCLLLIGTSGLLLLYDKWLISKTNGNTSQSSN